MGEPMKRKRTKIQSIPWTPFQLCNHAVAHGGIMLKIENNDSQMTVRNSRYTVAIYALGSEEPFGPMVHLSIKTNDRAAHHDWRDLQRIKNELCGDEAEAVELYPAESRLVDAANQYHLFVCKPGGYRFPFGFKERLVADGDWMGAKQRPFEVRPKDCLNSEQFSEYARKFIERSE